MSSAFLCVDIRHDFQKKNGSWTDDGSSECNWRNAYIDIYISLIYLYVSLFACLMSFRLFVCRHKSTKYAFQHPWL